MSATVSAAQDQATLNPLLVSFTPFGQIQGVKSRSAVPGGGYQIWVGGACGFPGRRGYLSFAVGADTQATPSWLAEKLEAASTSRSPGIEPWYGSGQARPAFYRPHEKKTREREKTTPTPLVLSTRRICPEQAVGLALALRGSSHLAACCENNKRRTTGRPHRRSEPVEGSVKCDVCAGQWTRCVITSTDSHGTDSPPQSPRSSQARLESVVRAKLAAGSLGRAVTNSCSRRHNYRSSARRLLLTTSPAVPTLYSVFCVRVRLVDDGYRLARLDKISSSSAAADTKFAPGGELANPPTARSALNQRQEQRAFLYAPWIKKLGRITKCRRRQNSVGEQSASAQLAELNSRWGGQGSGMYKDHLTSSGQNPQTAKNLGDIK
ncbi:hypothetical protein Bbelb_106100 [Branchiostoma belcheri]|nr:hypothetical protein Bbelb_106100 [Branchiostoma belcheri]